MPTASKTFRIFVSSTFSDLKAERNALQEKVFPELQKLCEANGCRFQAVDLRWGVSEEAALDQQTMNICLTELKRCQVVSPRPNFIILLGDRYGWIPLPPQVEASEFAEILSRVADDDKTLLAEWYRLDTNAVPSESVLRPRREDVFAEADYASWGKTEERLRAILLGAINSLRWPENDKRRIKHECSATHQEIIEGALKLPDEREHVFAFLRNIQNIEDLPPGSDYADVGVERARALKETLKEIKGVTSYSYDVTWSGQALDARLERFTADALASLRRIIEAEFRQLQQIDELARENIAHEEFGAERCRHFVGRQKILDDITAYLRRDQPSPLVIHGPSGSGKSALMAKALLDAAGEEKPANITQRHIIQRFVGATPESTDIRTLLRNLCLEITHAFGFDHLKEQELANVTDPKARHAVIRKYEIPEEYRYLSERFREFLGMIPGDRRLLLFLDALDQLSATDSAHSLNWLPSALPANVKVVVSVLEREDDTGQCLRSAMSKVPKSALLRLEDMTLEEGEQALRTWLLEAYPEKKRTLTDEQMESVLDRFRGCPKPLYLKLAFEEARRWKSYDGLPSGADNVPGLAGDVPGVVGDMLARLRDKKQHGEVLVKTFLGLLSAARHGLSESEILELLSADEVVMADLKARSARSPEAKGIPAVIWLRLYYDLAPYLIERSAHNTVLLACYHRQVGETVKRDYVRPEWHTRLARHFRKKADPNGDSTWSGNHVHGLAELPFQQTEGGSMWDELEATLTELNFIAAKSKAGLTYDLMNDYNAALDALPEPTDDVEPGASLDKTLASYISELVSYSSRCNALLDPSHLGSDEIPMPAPPIPPPSVRPHEGAEIGVAAAEVRATERTERIRAFGRFVDANSHGLARFGTIPAFVVQQAYNFARSGPVASAAEERLREYSGLPLVLRSPLHRPNYTRYPLRKRTLSGAGVEISCIACTPDAKTLVTGAWSGEVHVWDVRRGECLALLGVHEKPSRRVNCVAIGAAGGRAVSGGEDRRVYLWDLDAQQHIGTLEGHNGEIKAVGLTPDARLALSVDGHGVVKVWDVQEQVCSSSFETTATIFGGGVRITSDGRHAVLAGSNDTLELWDLKRELCLRTIEAKHISSLAITPDGRRAIAGCSYVLGGDEGPECETVRVWDLESGQQIAMLEGHTDDICSVSITADGRLCASGDRTGVVRVWDLDDAKCLREIRAHQCFATVVLTWDGRLLISHGSMETTVALWDIERGGQQENALNHSGRVTSVSVTPDRTKAVSASADQTLGVWQFASGRRLASLAGHRHIVTTVDVTPDGRYAISGSVDETLRMWDLDSEKCVAVLTGHEGGLFPMESRGFRAWVHSVKVGPCGRFALSGSRDSTVRLWDLDSERCVRTLRGLRPLSEVTQVLFTPDGQRALSDGDGFVRLWRLDRGACVLVRKGHSPLAVTPDALRAISVDADQALCVWELNSSTDVMKLNGHVAAVNDMRITPDGRRALSAGNDGTVRLWDLASGVCLAVLQTDLQVSCLSEIGPNGEFACGNARGEVLFYQCRDHFSGRPVVTATRQWIRDPQRFHGRWASDIEVRCPWCAEVSVLPVAEFETPSSEHLGGEPGGALGLHVCSRCGEKSGLNGYTVDMMALEVAFHVADEEGGDSMPPAWPHETSTESREAIREVQEQYERTRKADLVNILMEQSDLRVKRSDLARALDSDRILEGHLRELAGTKPSETGGPALEAARMLIECLKHQTTILVEQGDRRRAVSVLREAEACIQELEDVEGLCGCISDQCDLLLELGERDAALVRFRNLEEISRRNARHGGVVQALYNQAVILREHDFARARQLAREAARLALDLGDSELGRQIRSGVEQLFSTDEGRAHHAPPRRLLFTTGVGLLLIAVGLSGSVISPWWWVLGGPLVVLGLCQLIFCGLAAAGVVMLISCPRCGEQAILWRGQTYCRSCTRDDE